MRDEFSAAWERLVEAGEQCDGRSAGGYCRSEAASTAMTGDVGRGDGGHVVISFLADSSRASVSLLRLK